MTLCNNLKESLFSHCALFHTQLINVFHLQLTNFTSHNSVTFYVLITVSRSAAFLMPPSWFYTSVGQHTWWFSSIISSLQNNDVTLTYDIHSSAKLRQAMNVPCALCMEEKTILSCHVPSFHCCQHHYISFCVLTPWSAMFAIGW